MRHGLILLRRHYGKLAAALLLTLARAKGKHVGGVTATTAIEVFLQPREQTV